MKYFNDYQTIEGLRSLYKQYCIELHPDKENGSHESFCEMKAEYEHCLNLISGKESIKGKPAFDLNSEKELMEAIEKLMRVPDLNIELCGSWLWVTGDTRTHKDKLKAFGFKFSKKKVSWYFSPYVGKTKRRGRYSMDKIRDMHGSQTIKTGNVKEKLLA